MIKNLTKSQYYKEKKIPIVTMCRKLEPEVPARTHLLEPLPRLGTELQKIQAKSSCQNKINLELANALKIIHELEYQLQVMTTNCHSYEEELFVSKNSVKDLERKINKLQEKCLGLEASKQKAQFNMKVKIEQEKDQWSTVVAQYERKIDQLNDAYNRLKSDREKELKNAEKFHQSTINKANIQLQEIESSAQSDIKKFQRELQKATQQNIIMRQKLTDLDTCNQEHLRELRKANNDLAQTNLRLKTEYEHKIVTLIAELELHKNKNSELFDALSLFQKRYTKQAQNWAQEKAGLNQQQMETQATLKKSYDEIMRQKEKILQQLNKKGFQLNGKQKKLLEHIDRVKQLERVVADFDHERSSMLSNFQRTRKELVSKMEAQFQIKIHESNGIIQRQMHQKTNQLVEQERRLQQQKLNRQIQKWAQKISSSEAQIMQHIQNAKLAQQQSRKLEFTIQQLKIQLQHQRNAFRDQAQSLKTQIDSQSNEFEHRYRNLQNVHNNEMEKVKNDHSMLIQNLKLDFEVKLREIERIAQTKDGLAKDLQTKLRRLDEDYTGERMSFISRVQAFEVTLGKLKNTNQQLSRVNSDLQSKLMQGDNQFRNLQVALQQQIQQKKRKLNELKQAESEIRRLRQEIDRRQFNAIQKQKKIQSEIFELRRKEAVLQSQTQNYRKRAKELESRCEDLVRQIKLEEQNRVNLQKRLSQIDNSSQEKWKIIESDFAHITKKQAQESQRMEKQLKDKIAQKDNQINQLNIKINDVQSALMKERNEFHSSNITWKNKYAELEQSNKKLTKSSFNMQDLEKQNILKQANINGLKKQLEKLKADLQMKEREIQDLLFKIQQSESSSEVQKNENFQKLSEIKNLTFKIAETQRQFTALKDRVSKEAQQFERKNLQRNQEMRRKQQQIRSLQKILEQQAGKYSKLYEEKRRIQIRIQQIQKQHDEDLTRKKSQKIESIKRISELEAVAQQIELNWKEKISKIQFEISVKNQELIDREAEIKRLLKKVQSLESNLFTNNQQLKNLKMRYDSEKFSAAEYKSQLERLKFERSEFERKVKLMIEQIERLEKQSQKTEKDIMKIYQQSDKRVEIAIQETKSFYQKQIQNKNIEIEAMEKKLKISLEEEREESKKRQSKMNEEKQQIYKQVIEKSCKITEITIAYEELGQVYEQVFKQLQIYKKKWNKMFSQFNDNNQQLTEINFKLHDFRTEDKKTKKVIKQIIEVKTDKTERIMTAAENETPISQNAGTQRTYENQNSNRVISAFNHSETFNGLRTGNRVLTTLMSNSGVINSNQASSDSVRLDSSSISSKISNRNE